MPRGDTWNRDQLLVAFRLYTRLHYGSFSSTNPEVISHARGIGRTPDAVVMKACNFASLDPAQQARGVKGLRGASRGDRAIWAEFSDNSEALAAAAEEAFDRLSADVPDVVCPADEEPEPVPPDGPTEVLRTVRARRVQRFFSAAVLASYEHRCALTGLGVRELLNASHIIPWSESVERRAHPSNGIALNVLYDRAFDRGLITFDEDLRVIISPRLKCEPMDGYQRGMVEQVEGKQLRPPVRFRPDMEAVRWHRERAGCVWGPGCGASRVIPHDSVPVEP